jgi:hypothetical protein
MACGCVERWVSASRCDARAAASVVAAAAVVVTWTAGCDGSRGPVLSVPSASRPKLLYTPSEEPTGVDGLTYLRDHLAEVEQGPFDGLTVDVGLGDAPWGTAAYTRAQFDAEVDVLRSIPFSKLTDNFQMFNVREGGVDWFDDQAFAVVVGNARVAAEVVRDAGLRGLFFDVEQYDDPVWSRPTADDTVDLAGYEVQAHRRGVELMTAMLEVVPDITIIATVSFSEVFRSVCLAGTPLEDERYRLLPAFLDGMFEARAIARAPALIVDGFLGSYAAREPRPFPVFRELIQGDWEGVQQRWHPGIASYRFGTGVVDWDAEPSLKCADGVRSKLTRDMPAAFGVMIDFDFVLGMDFHTDPSEFDLNFFTPDALAATLSGALGSAERYVYVWTSSIDWIGVSTQPRVPAAYQRAVSAARGERR